MSKALDALHAHLKKQNRATPRTKENEIICHINRSMDLIILDLLKLARHTQNRIAAHKAHVTMAKKRGQGSSSKGQGTATDRQGSCLGVNDSNDKPPLT